MKVADGGLGVVAACMAKGMCMARDNGGRRVLWMTVHGMGGWVM